MAIRSVLEISGERAQFDRARLGSDSAFYRLLADRYKTYAWVLSAQMLSIMGFRSPHEIKDVLANPSHKADITEKAYERFGNILGLREHGEKLREVVDGYAQTADEAVDYLRIDPFQRVASRLQTRNEVSTHNIVDLILIVFDDRELPGRDPRSWEQARFEAARKLTLIKLAAKNAQRERLREGDKAIFDDFLNNFIDTQIAIGEPRGHRLLSRHSSETFACVQAPRLYTAEDAPDPYTLEPGQKLTNLPMRQFVRDDISSQGNRYRDLYVHPRIEKDLAKTTLKLFRKEGEDPEGYVEDQLAIMLVVKQTSDLRALTAKLIFDAADAGKGVDVEDFEDTIHTNGRQGKLPAGGSALIRWRKFIANRAGTRIEMILFTFQGYINYLTQRGVAHREYELNRALNIAEAMFPEPIYHVSFAREQVAMRRAIRDFIEDPTVIL